MLHGLFLPLPDSNLPGQPGVEPTGPPNGSLLTHDLAEIALECRNPAAVAAGPAQARPGAILPPAANGRPGRDPAGLRQFRAPATAKEPGRAGPAAI